MLDAPTKRRPSASSSTFSLILCVLAATVVSHGLGWSSVLSPGPLLPAEADTKTPAAAALRNASSTGSITEDSEPLPIEKLMTSTPSLTASSTPCARSLVAHPSPATPVQQTL